MQSSKRSVFRVSAVLGSSVLALIACDGLARLYSPHWLGKGGEKNRFCVYDPEIGWVNKPGAKGRFAQQDFDVAVSISGKGLRDVDHPYPKMPGVTRVAVFGDSFAWGYGVEQDQRFTDILQRRLAGRAEVINFGCSGYGQDQEWMLLEREGPRYRPDVVIVMVHPASDFDDNTNSYRSLSEKPLFYLERGELRVTNVPVPRESAGKRALRWMSERSVLWNVLAERRIRDEALSSIFVRSFDRLLGSPVRNRASRTPAEEMTSLLSMRIVQTSRSLGADALFVLIPDLQPGSRQIKPDKRVEGLRTRLRQAGISFLDLEGVFQSAARSERATPARFAHDPHWNAHGHEIAAEAMLAWLGRRVPALRDRASQNRSAPPSVK